MSSLFQIVNYWLLRTSTLNVTCTLHVWMYVQSYEKKSYQCLSLSQIHPLQQLILLYFSLLLLLQLVWLYVHVDIISIIEIMYSDDKYPPWCIPVIAVCPIVCVIFIIVFVVLLVAALLVEYICQNLKEK